MPTGKYERKSAFTAKQRKRISDRMRHALTALGYTHEKRGSISVAKKLAGISSSSWHNSVNTGEQLGEAAVAKFCAGLKVERHWLVNGEGPMMQEGTDFVKAADQPSERAAVKKPRTACPEPPQYVPLRELRPVPESPSASGTLDALVAELAEETRKIATARARIAELSTQIKANVAA